MTVAAVGSPQRVIRNLLAGLTVSFVAISLGAAFGILSGRGAFAGIISAGIIALVTAALGGTRLQCSGPTAPMTAVTVAVVAFAREGLRARVPGLDPDRFVNLVLVLAALLLLAAAALRLGRFIRIVPRVVVSGFMNGIAILIWLDQVRKLLGVGGKVPFGGPPALNVAIALATFALVMGLPRTLPRLFPRVGRHVPAALVTIVLVTLVAGVAQLDVERVSLRTTIASLGDFARLVQRQLPTQWPAAAVLAALPFAFQLAMLCYLDTLLTSLVVDRLSGERTRQDKELMAQGVANGLVAAVGGIPGAQATIRSVLILNEGATARLAGIAVGAFVVVELLALQDLINLIPHAVFSGVLLKVGYDVFDWRPVRLYAQARLGVRVATATVLPPTGAATHVGHAEMLFIVGTTLVTVLWDLNVAVISFAALFYVVRRWAVIPDLTPFAETAAIVTED